MARGELPVLRPLPEGRVRAQRRVGDGQQPRRAARSPAALGHLLRRFLGQGHGREHQPEVRRPLCVLTFRRAGHRSCESGWRRVSLSCCPFSSTPPSCPDCPRPSAPWSWCRASLSSWGSSGGEVWGVGAFSPSTFALGDGSLWMEPRAGSPP